MIVCYNCAKPVDTKTMVNKFKPFPRTYHPECYDRAELNANCELHASERDEFAQFDLHELLAYWRILQMSAKCLQVTDDPYRTRRHQRFVYDELEIRGHRPRLADELTKKKPTEREIMAQWRKKRR